MSKTLLLIYGLVVAIPLSVVCALYTWKTYPLKMSRSQRYRTSRWDYVKNRIIGTLAAFIAPLFLFLLIYSAW